MLVFMDELPRIRRQLPQQQESVMTLGQYIKQLRTDMELSQPQFAERMQVEQSYLSKLENDKSTPSNEVFRQLLSALSMDVDAFMSGLKDKGNMASLRQIPDLDSWYASQQVTSEHKQRKLLYSAMLLIALGSAVFYIGFQKILLPERLYEYRSEGVVLAGEPEDIFSVWHQFTDTPEQREIKKREMHQRESIKIILTYTYQGRQFTTSDGDNRRLYRQVVSSEREQTRIGNVLMQFFGLLSTIAGLVLLIIEPKLSRQSR